MMKSYSEILKFNNYIDRFNYVKLLDGKIGAATFGGQRYLNQRFYSSSRWKDFCDEIHLRDSIGDYICDLGCEGFEIMDECKVIVHHLNPVTVNQIIDDDPWLYDPENVICVSMNTHNAIHYGSLKNLCIGPTIRRPGDTKIW